MHSRGFGGFFAFFFLKGRGTERKTKQYQLLHPPNQKSTEQVFKSSGLEEEEKGRAESGSGKGEEFCWQSHVPSGLGARAQLPGLRTPAGSPRAVPPGLHDRGQPDEQGVLPVAGSRAWQHLWLPGGPGPVHGGASRHQALERSLRPPQPGRPRRLAQEVLPPDLPVHRWGRRAEPAVPWARWGGPRWEGSPFSGREETLKTIRRGFPWPSKFGFHRQQTDDALVLRFAPSGPPDEYYVGQARLCELMPTCHWLVCWKGEANELQSKSFQDDSVASPSEMGLHL